jgi:hypothetical protein
VIHRRVESFAKYAGIATVGAEWSALLWYYLRVPMYFGGEYPLSLFATLPETRLVFIVCYVLAGIFCWIFVKHHLDRHFQVPLRIFGISLLLFVLTALFPFSFDNAVSTAIHGGLALGAGLLFALGMFVMAKRSKDQRVRQVTLAAVVLSLGLTLAYMAQADGSPWIFTLEAGSWLMLQLWMIWITFYIRKNKGRLT